MTDHCSGHCLRLTPFNKQIFKCAGTTDLWILPLHCIVLIFDGLTSNPYHLPAQQLSNLALPTSKSLLFSGAAESHQKLLLYSQPARHFAMVVGRRLFAAFAAVSSMGFFGFYVPQSIKVLAEEKEHAACLSIVGEYKKREGRNKREGQHEAMKVDRSIQKTALLFGEREERVVEVAAAEAQKIAADNKLACVEVSYNVVSITIRWDHFEQLCKLFSGDQPEVNVTGV